MLTRPRGPILGANDEVAPTSPPTHRKFTAKIHTNLKDTIHRKPIMFFTGINSYRF